MSEQMVQGIIVEDKDFVLRVSTKQSGGTFYVDTRKLDSRIDSIKRKTRKKQVIIIQDGVLLCLDKKVTLGMYDKRRILAIFTQLKSEGRSRVSIYELINEQKINIDYTPVVLDLP